MKLLHLIALPSIVFTSCVTHKLTPDTAVVPYVECKPYSTDDVAKWQSATEAEMKNVERISRPNPPQH